MKSHSATLNRRAMVGAVASLTGIAATRTRAATGRELDPFGGWTGRTFEATGYFRVEKADRWWLVTPQGNAFLSFGINHLYQDLFRQEYNGEAWKKRLAVESLKGQAFKSALNGWFLDTCESYGFNTVGV
ncbi:MAG: hypothetical protein AAFU85_22215, partial [Planctomycetota bacterium]